MSCFYDLPEDIIRLIYCWDNTYRDIFKNVLRQLRGYKKLTILKPSNIIGVSKTTYF